MKESAAPAAASSSVAEEVKASAQAPLLFALGLATFMVVLDGRVIAPLLPTIADDFHTSVAHVSWLVSGYMLPYGFCQLAYGPVADRFGKVRVAAHAMLAFSVGTALCGAFPSFAAIVLLRALTGAAAAALIPLTIAYIGDTVPYERRQAALATLMASAGAAQAFSTAAGGTIASLVSWRTVFPILGALAAVATSLLYVYRGREVRVAPARGAPSARYGDALRAPGMRGLLLLVSWEGFLYMGGFSFVSALLERRFGTDALTIGLIMGMAGVASVASARALPRILRRVGERSLVRIGGVVMGLGYLLCALAPRPALVAFASALLGSGFSLCHSTLQTCATESFPEARGTALSLFAFSLFAGAALGTACIGYGADLVGYGPTFAALGGSMLLFTALADRWHASRVSRRLKIS